MPYIFTGLPADSSELETYKGYEVLRCPAESSGGPPAPSPTAEGDELVLDFGDWPKREPVKVRWARREEPRSIRRLPWRSRSIITNFHLASLLIVPALCFLMVWGLARL